MPEEHGDVRRRDDGSIDYDYYHRKSVSLRTQAMTDLLARAGRLIRALATPLAASAAARRTG
jgi:hypothetical protein